MASLKLIHSESVSPDKRGLPYCFMHCRVPLNYSINTEKVSHRPLYVSGMDCYYKLNKKSDFLLCMSLYKMKASPASFIGNQRVVTKEVLPVASLSCRAPLCCSSWERSQSSLLPWSILPRGEYFFQAEVNIFSSRGWIFFPGRGVYFFQ